MWGVCGGCVDVGVGVWVCVGECGYEVGVGVCVGMCGGVWVRVGAYLRVCI